MQQGGTMQDETIRRMRRADLDIAIDWAADEGWNPGLADAECYWQTDPHGFFIGEVGGSGEMRGCGESGRAGEAGEVCKNGAGRQPIAVISALRYGANFGFLGFYMVAAPFRGQGYGIAIWEEGLRHLAGCTIGLDGVVAQQANYQRSGFELAYRNIRFESVGLHTLEINPAILEVRTLPFDLIANYDAPFFPEQRHTFLRAWVSAPHHHALCYFEHGTVKGYGVIRRCRTGHKIGPLCADTPDIAEALYDALCARIGAGIPVFLDVPETNPHAVTLAEQHHMKRVFETARMYRGVAPEIDIARLYGVTSFEIG